MLRSGSGRAIVDDMNPELNLYTIFGNACPEEIDGEWSHFTLDLHCMTIKVWCKFEGETVIVREWALA